MHYVSYVNNWIEPINSFKRPQVNFPLHFLTISSYLKMTKIQIYFTC